MPTRALGPHVIPEASRIQTVVALGTSTAPCPGGAGACGTSGLGRVGAPGPYRSRLQQALGNLLATLRSGEVGGQDLRPHARYLVQVLGQGGQALMVSGHQDQVVPGCGELPDQLKPDP